MQPKKKRSSIRDVARLAGVSTATVSFVYHEPARVKEETRKAVLEAAKQLSYIPNLSASALRGKSNLVALIINFHFDEIHHPTVIEALPYIAQYLKDYGYYLMPFFQYPDDEAKELYSLAETGQLAGALFMASRKDLHVLDYFTKNEVPVVVIGAIEMYKHKAFFVDNNNVEDAARLVRHAHSLGYKKIAYLSGDLDYIVCQQRLAGYYQAVNEIGCHGPLVFGYCENRLDIEKSIREIASLDQRPDALIAKDDIKGIYAIGEFYKLGIIPGKDIGITSIGGVNAATYTTPQLSSISFSVREIAQTAVSALHYNIIKPVPKTGIHFVESRFIERGSLPRKI